MSKFNPQMFEPYFSLSRTNDYRSININTAIIIVTVLIMQIVVIASWTISHNCINVLRNNRDFTVRQRGLFNFEGLLAGSPSGGLFKFFENSCFLPEMYHGYPAWSIAMKMSITLFYLFCIN